MRVYHLLSVKWALCDLEHQHLKVARFDDLNDPFELLGVALRDKERRRRFKRWRTRAAARHGLLCFCTTWHNPVLWSHYAEAHTGMCLGFDVPRQCLREVKYVQTRPPFDQCVPREGQGPLFWTKFKGWEYEAEHRRIVSLRKADEVGRCYFWRFGTDLDLREVVVGARCGVERRCLERLTNGVTNKIELKKARLAFGSFNVVEDQRGLN